MKEKILTNVRIIDPSQNIDEIGNIIINTKGKIESLIFFAFPILFDLTALNNATCKSEMTLPAPDSKPLAPITSEDINQAL